MKRKNLSQISQITQIYSFGMYFSMEKHTGQAHLRNQRNLREFY